MTCTPCLIDHHIAAAFFARVRFAGPYDCWLWTGSVKPNGYGNLGSRRTNSQNYYPHRLAYAFFYGVDPGELLVCHTCDNRLCVNPKHLFLGTHADNALDMKNKDRSNRGERHGIAKLNDGLVREIRSAVSQGISQREVGAKFGISQSGVSQIVRGKRWSHVK